MSRIRSSILTTVGVALLLPSATVADAHGRHAAQPAALTQTGWGGELIDTNHRFRSGSILGVGGLRVDGKGSALAHLAVAGLTPGVRYRVVVSGLECGKAHTSAATVASISLGRAGADGVRIRIAWPTTLLQPVTAARSTRLFAGAGQKACGPAFRVVSTFLTGSPPPDGLGFSVLTGTIRGIVTVPYTVSDQRVVAVLKGLPPGSTSRLAGIDEGCGDPFTGSDVFVRERVVADSRGVVKVDRPPDAALTGSLASINCMNVLRAATGRDVRASARSVDHVRNVDPGSASRAGARSSGRSGSPSL